MEAASAFGYPKGTPSPPKPSGPLSTLPHHPTSVPQSPADPALDYSPGRLCSANAHLLEPQLVGNWVWEHPPRPGSRELGPARTFLPGGGSAAAREPASPVAIPQCTVPQRERACHRPPGDRPPCTRGQRRQRCSPEDEGQAALGHPSVFTFVSREEPAV